MGEKTGSEAAFLAFGVGKSSHRVCAVSAGSEVLFNRKATSGQTDMDRALAEAGTGTKVVSTRRESSAHPSSPGPARQTTRSPTRLSSR